MRGQVEEAVPLVGAQPAVDCPAVLGVQVCACRQGDIDRKRHQRLFAMSNLNELRHLIFDNFQARGRVGLADPARWNTWNTVQGQIAGTVTVARTNCHSGAQSVTRMGESVTLPRASVILGRKGVTVAAPEVSLSAGTSVTRKGARGGWIEGGMKGDHAPDCSAGRRCRTAGGGGCGGAELRSRGTCGGWQSFGGASG